jgi:D-alanyl-D-alanine carboxypeptidase (penicillin-binding protein 5/6)
MTGLRALLLLATLTVLVVRGMTAAAYAQAIETQATSAFMIDASTGTILLSKNPDASIPPASMAKLMTAEVVFHALKEGRLNLEDQYQVSVNAWRTGGAPSGTSTMFAEVNSRVSVGNLLQGLIVQSANDGAIALAEGMAGSEADFAALMNQRAKIIGLTASQFSNASGLPAEGQRTTVRDLVALAAYLWREYPDRYALFAQREFTWNKIFQRNRNPLLAMEIGADGLAVGASEEAGFGIVASLERDGRRVFLAMSGIPSDRARPEEARKVLEWGMRAFETLTIFKDGEVVGEVSTYGAEQSGLPVVAKGPVAILVPIANRDRLVARIVYQGPVEAPVEQGARIGDLKVWIGDDLSQQTPLYAARSLERGPLHHRAMDAIKELAIGWLR